MIDSILLKTKVTWWALCRNRFHLSKVLWKEVYILLKFIDLFDLSSQREIGYKLFYGIGLSSKVRFRWVKWQLNSEGTNYEHLLVAVLLSRFPKKSFESNKAISLFRGRLYDCLNKFNKNCILVSSCVIGEKNWLK
jgi:hypothetical protein